MRVVIGVPMYSSEELVGEALDALLAQTYEDFAVVAIDDCSPDATYAVASARADGDPRVTVEANDRRRGSWGNWNRVLARALELNPHCELFAWASDNDLHEPTWLAEAVGALDANPAAVLAYSRGGEIVDGVRVPPRTKTEKPAPVGATDRMSAVVHGRREIAMFYGLQRADTLRRIGGKPRVIVPDVLLLAYLALFGEFARCPDGLWYRGSRQTGRSRRRQRAVLFPNRSPPWVWLPVSVQHAGWLTRQLVIGNRRPPGVGRLSGAALVARFCLETARRKLEKKRSKARRAQQTA